MVIRGSGIFKGFDLEDANSLHELASCLIDWREGSKEPKYGLEPITAIRIQRNTIERIARLMEESMLINEIVGHLLDAFANSTRPGPLAEARGGLLLEAGQLLSQYVVCYAESPRDPQYHEALKAWISRTPLVPPAAVQPNHEANIAQIMAEMREEQEKRRVENKQKKKDEKAREKAKKKGTEVGSDDEEAAIQREIDAYNKKVVAENKTAIAKDAAEDRATERKEEAMWKKRVAEAKAKKNPKSKKRAVQSSGVSSSGISSSPAPVQTPVQQPRIACRGDTTHLANLISYIEYQKSRRQNRLSSPRKSPKVKYPKIESSGGRQTRSQTSKLASSSPNGSSPKVQPPAQKPKSKLQSRKRTSSNSESPTKKIEAQPKSHKRKRPAAKTKDDAIIFPGLAKQPRK